MYTYPIKFEFPMINIGRQVDVRNGDGKFIMRASGPFVSFKDSMSIVNGSGKTVYQKHGRLVNTKHPDEFHRDVFLFSAKILVNRHIIFRTCENNFEFINL